MVNLNYNKIKLLFNTVKYLRFEQVFYRALYKFKKPMVKFSPSEFVECYSWSWQGPVINDQSVISATRVRFLALEGDIGGTDVWNDPNKEKLWLYNLHYFDDLNAVDYEQRKEIHTHLISRWIDENPVCSGNGWEPYPISLRIVNWVKWLSKQEKVEQSVLVSLMKQADALSQQLEYHILGNHLFANSKALIFIGCFIRGVNSRNFLNLGLKVLERELSEQFLKDGGHFELSPMYHVILLWDLLELIDLAQTCRNPELCKILPMMKKVATKSVLWLQSMVHPDGEISFFNDSAIGIAAKPSQVYDYAKKLGVYEQAEFSPLYTNLDSGYSRISLGGFTCIFDHGLVGPDYLPGHAHADTLSFELSLGLQRLFVNSGTSLYGVSSERLRQRSSPAHNVLVVDNENSSEVWSGFRVARRARAILLSSKSSTNLTTIRASHDGYGRLKSKVLHERQIDVSDQEVVIKDVINGNANNCESHYHLHPDIQIESANEAIIYLRLPNGRKVALNSNNKFIISNCTWHPRFGVSIPNKKLIFRLDGSEHILTIKTIEL